MPIFKISHDYHLRRLPSSKTVKLEKVQPKNVGFWISFSLNVILRRNGIAFCNIYIYIWIVKCDGPVCLCKYRRFFPSYCSSPANI